MPEERPSPQTPCVVDSCTKAATLYVDIAGGHELEGESTVAMCDEHATHWRGNQQ
jgi:hypothetical protein